MNQFISEYSTLDQLFFKFLEDTRQIRFKMNDTDRTVILCEINDLQTMVAMWIDLKVYPLLEGSKQIAKGKLLLEEVRKLYLESPELKDSQNNKLDKPDVK